MILLLVAPGVAGAQLLDVVRDDAGIVGNALVRSSLDLSGEWDAIIDPFENGVLDYQSRPRNDGFWEDKIAAGPLDLVEYGFDDAVALDVPGDWNTQREDLFFYEGSVWYRKRFDMPAIDRQKRILLRVGGANRRSWVWLNGEPLGSNPVGFTPRCYEATGIVQTGTNSLVIRVDNRRDPAGVPGMRTDWWNYGGITRRVDVLTAPATFIRDAHAHLASDGSRVEGWVILDGPDAAERRVMIAVGDRRAEVRTGDDGTARFSLDARGLERWHPGPTPALHAFTVRLLGREGVDDLFEDRVGLRTVETRGTSILVNGEPTLLLGICVHEEQIRGDGRSWSRAHAEELVGELRALNANFVRLAHYPHAEVVTRTLDEAGILAWAEVPVYWKLDYENPETKAEAIAHLRGLITRDHNRASVAVWSIGNETGSSDVVTVFRNDLAAEVRRLDPTRLLAAALQASRVRGDGDIARFVVDDPFGATVDVLAVNSYIGWYGGRIEDLEDIRIELAWQKPFMVSEFGAGAKRGLVGGLLRDDGMKWTEAYQARLYRATLAWMKRSDAFAGVSPWILSDFRSPRRQLPGVQDWWNRKGVLDERGRPKQAHAVLAETYKRWSTGQQ